MSWTKEVTIHASIKNQHQTKDIDGVFPMKDVQNTTIEKALRIDMPKLNSYISEQDFNKDSHLDYNRKFIYSNVTLHVLIQSGNNQNKS